MAKRNSLALLASKPISNLEVEMVYFGWLKDFNCLQTASDFFEIEQWEYHIPKTDNISIGAIIRVRKTIKNGKPIYTFTTKTKGGEININTPLISVEHENFIEKSQFDQFKLFAQKGFHKTRYHFPTSNGLVYEIDVFFTTSGKPSKFVKIDLEIPKNYDLAKLPSLPDFITNPIMEQDGFRKEEDEITVKRLWKTFSLENEFI